MPLTFAIAITLCDFEGLNCTEAIYKNHLTRQECEYQITDQRLFSAHCLKMDNYTIKDKS